jgi:hypothetical protein
VKTVCFDELPPYPVRSFTYRDEQVRADEVQRVIVYSVLVRRDGSHGVAVRQMLVRHWCVNRDVVCTILLSVCVGLRRSQDKVYGIILRSCISLCSKLRTT